MSADVPYDTSSIAGLLDGPDSPNFPAPSTGAVRIQDPLTASGTGPSSASGPSTSALPAAPPEVPTAANGCTEADLAAQRGRVANIQRGASSARYEETRRGVRITEQPANPRPGRRPRASSLDNHPAESLLQPEPPQADAPDYITVTGPKRKWGSDSFYMSGVFSHDPSKVIQPEVNWFRNHFSRRFGGPVYVRAAEGGTGDVRWTTRLRVLTEMGHGHEQAIEQLVKRAVPALTDEFAFNVRYSDRQSFRESTTSCIKEFRVTEDSVDYRQLSTSIQARLGVDRIGSLVLANACCYGLEWGCTTTWYTKLWLLYFHVAWHEMEGLVAAPLPTQNEVCRVASLRPPPADAAATWQLIASFCAAGNLIIFENDTTDQDRFIYWMAANGLPRFATPAADPVRHCLLDRFTVPPDPLLFVFNDAAVLPVMRYPTSNAIIRAIALQCGFRTEQRFALAGFIRASCYFNRWRPYAHGGNNQAFVSTLEWRFTEWPAPLFSNSLLMTLRRISIPDFPWAAAELRCLMTSSPRNVLDVSVWVAAAVCLSVSSTLSTFSITGGDLSSVHTEAEDWRRQRLPMYLLQLARRANSPSPAILQIAAGLREQMGLPSLGVDAFMMYTWNTGFNDTLGVLNARNGWAVHYARAIPYLVDPLAMLWMVQEYMDVWYIPRAPLTYRIKNEFVRALSRGEDYFFPSRGDPMMQAEDVTNFMPEATVYVPLLLAILAQSTRVNCPNPSRWFEYNHNNFIALDLPADDESIPLFEFRPDFMVFRAGTVCLWSWIDQTWVCPAWRHRDLNNAWWERIYSVGVEHRPAIGIEPVDKAAPTVEMPGTFDILDRVNRAAESGLGGRLLYSL